MADTFTALERNILKAKGVSDAELELLIKAGVSSRANFQTVGDVGTLLSLVPEMKAEVAQGVMQWATGAAAMPQTQGPVSSGPVLVDSADVVYCTHCKAKQPKDYKSGDLCFSCGKQAEPILSCFWCSAAGPGKFCRSCGAEFVPTGEFDLAVLLRREGLPKDEIPKKLRTMDHVEKDDLWGRVRRSRG